MNKYFSSVNNIKKLSQVTVLNQLRLNSSITSRALRVMTSTSSRSFSSGDNGGEVQMSESGSSGNLSQLHKKKQSNHVMDPKYFKDDFFMTQAKELDIIRSPFYDIARAERMSKEQARELYTMIELKLSSMGPASFQFRQSAESIRNEAYTRYADNLAQDVKSQRIFRVPRNKAFERINAGELFRNHKPANYIERLKQDKSFVAETFFPPYDLKESNLKHLFSMDPSIYAYPEEESVEFLEWRDQLAEIIPQLNHDIIVNLALYLAFEAKLNDKKIWRAIEDQVVSSINLFTTTQISQLEFASTELKPKYFRPRVNTLLVAKAMESIEKADQYELMCILQGFRKKKSKDIYAKIRNVLIEKKEQLFQEKEETERAKLLANFFYCLASNKPQQYGAYEVYHFDDLKELFAHYEEDFKTSILLLDGEHLARFAQALYLFKMEDFEPLWYRVEVRAQQIAKSLTKEQTVQILRSLSHALNHRMWGEEKTFVQLEPNILQNMEEMDDRDVCYAMYAYSVRNSGNPELYQAFNQRLDKMAGNLDYPSLYNAVYYMLFTENPDPSIWKQLVEATASNPDILPIIYYRPFKASEYFLKQHFPEMDLRDYTDKFYFAERYYNVIQDEGKFMSDERYTDFKCFLTAICFLYPIPFLSIDNLFLLHFVFYEQKIAINFHLESTLIYGKSEPTELQKLTQKLLKYEGWEILELSEKEFNDWTFEERVENIKGWVKAAKERQIEKGIIDREPKIYV